MLTSWPGLNAIGLGLCHPAGMSTGQSVAVTFALAAEWTFCPGGRGSDIRQIKAVSNVYSPWCCMGTVNGTVSQGRYEPCVLSDKSLGEGGNYLKSQLGFQEVMSLSQCPGKSETGMALCICGIGSLWLSWGRGGGGVTPFSRLV